MKLHERQKPFFLPYGLPDLCCTRRLSAHIHTNIQVHTHILERDLCQTLYSVLCARLLFACAHHHDYILFFVVPFFVLASVLRKFYLLRIVQ